MPRPFHLALLLLSQALPLNAQQPFPTDWSPTLASRQDIKAALSIIERTYPKHVDEWIRLTQMPSPSHHENVRAAYIRQQLEAADLTVTTDSIGNVAGRRKGTFTGPTIVIASHMDIVQPMGVDLTVKHSGDTLRAPGVFDNTASIANVLAVVRAMAEAKVKSNANFVFLFTAQEEIGLRGMDWWLDHNPRPDMLIASDGGLGPIAYGALGIYWTKYTFSGEGSHTVTSRGKPTPVKALADAIDHIYQLKTDPLPEGAVLNVGQVHGGTIYNGIPQDLYFTMDLRGQNPVLIDSLDRVIDKIAADAAKREKLQYRKETVIRNKAGGTEAMLAGARRNPIVQTAIDIHHFLGIDVGAPGSEAVAAGTTDANMGVVRGIPSIAIGRANGGNQHTLTEWADGKSALPATKMVLLLLMSLGENKLQPSGIVP